MKINIFDNGHSVRYASESDEGPEMTENSVGAAFHVYGDESKPDLETWIYDPKLWDPIIFSGTEYDEMQTDMDIVIEKLTAAKKHLKHLQDTLDVELWSVVKGAGNDKE